MESLTEAPIQVPDRPPLLKANLIDGPVYRTLFRFTLPYLLSQVLQAMYGTADLMIVGQFSSAVSDLSAVSNGSHIIHVITNVMASFSIGSTVLIGQYLGSGQPERVSRAIGVSLSLSSLIALVFSLVTVCFSGLIVRLMNIPPEAVEATTQYLIICGSGILFISAYNTFSAVLRGLGDSTGPLVFIAIACGLNIALDLLFIGVLGLGVSGAAYATVTAQGVSVLFAGYRLKKKHRVFDGKPRSFRLHRDDAGKLIRLGTPIAAEALLVNMSFMFIGAMVNQFGVVASAAIGVFEKIGALTRLPASAFSASVAAMVSQNMGAGRVGRAKKTLWAGIVLSLSMCLVFFAMLKISPRLFILLYTDDPAVLSDSVQYMRSFSYDALLVCFTFCMAGFFSGCGKTVFTLVRNMTSTILVRVPMAYLFCHIATQRLFHVGLSAALASMASILICLVYLRFGKWQNQNLV